MNPMVLPVAVRAWAVPDYLAEKRNTQPAQRRPRHHDLGPSQWSLTFDTETHAAELGQGLRIVVGQVRQGDELMETVIGYDPEVLSTAEIEALKDYGIEHGFSLMTGAEFVEEVFYDVAWHRRGLVVGSVNLVFDLTRLAVGHHVSRPRRKDRAMRAGFTLKLSADPAHPEIQVKRINGRAAFVRFVTPPGRHPEARNRERGGAMANHRGYFVDVGVLGSALLGGKWSLARLAKTLATTSQKLDMYSHDRPIDAEYIDYGWTDVQTTWECFVALRLRYQALGLTTAPIHRLYSEASVAKAHLAEMGVRPWRQVQHDVPGWLIATIMATYHGGRTEAHIRHLPVPGTYVDVRSEYPTVYVLQGLWRYQIGEGIEWREEDPAAFQSWAEGIGVEELLDPALWRRLVAVVLVEPGDDRLPTRAAYTGGSAFNVAIAQRVGGPAQWITAADYLASKLHTGHAPPALRVIAFSPRAPQEGLQSLAVGGRADYEIDPYRDDLIARLVELRADIRNALKSLPDNHPERAVMEAAQQAMKVTANSVSYGAPIEMNVVTHPDEEPVTVYRPDGSTYRTKVNRTEEPGSYFHPLIATLVSGGGRLLLALVMSMVADKGGTYAICDTDSLFVVATEDGALPADVDCKGPARALAWAEVDEVVGRLARLNPLGGTLAGRSVLKVEAENYDDKGRQRELWCLAIASKRYALATRDDNGEPVLVGSDGNYKRSEHGLGHLVPPRVADPASEDKSWCDLIWLRLFRQAWGLAVEDPAWFDDPAVGRLSVTSPAEEQALRHYNAGRRHYRQKVRPWNFLMMAYPTHLGRRDGRTPSTLVAPFESKPNKRLRARWVDRQASAPTPTRIRTGAGAYVVDGTTSVRSMRDVVEEYRMHPEAKAAGLDGKPCQTWTVGQLRPLVVEAAGMVRIGKETNRLAEDLAVVDDAAGRAIQYVEQTCAGCGACIRGRRQKTWCSEACRKRSGRSFARA